MAGQPTPARVRGLLETLVAEGGERGVQVAAYLDGRLVVDAWAGLADVESGRPVDGATLFTAFSASKGVLSTCVHVLADRGLIDYDAPVARHWPEFGSRGKERATVRDALTHRLGIPNDPPGFDVRLSADWDDVCRRIAAMEPLWEPGTTTAYHPLTAGWVLGEVVRRVAGRPLAAFLQDSVCRPLAIDGMYFGVPPDREALVATLENARTEPALDLSGTPSLFDPAGAFNDPAVRRACVPGAGALVNARSLARMYAMLASGGEGVLSAATVALLSVPEPADAAPPVSGPNAPWWHAHGLGFTLGGGRGPRERRPRAFGYEGIGTIGFADPDARYAFAILKNRLDLSRDEMENATKVALAVEDVLGLR